MHRLLLMFTYGAILLLAGCFNGPDMNEQKTMIIAHRGASYLAPENTVASAVLAFQEDADGTEIDIHLSKDHRIMVMHDETTKRTSGIDLTICQTDSAKLRELEVGKFRSDAYAGEKIPYLEEVIAVIPQGRKLVIEIKSDREIVPYLKKAIEDSGKKEQMVIISFDFEALAECKKIMPSIPLYWLYETEKDNQTGQYPPYEVELIQKTAAGGMAGLDLQWEGLTKDFVEKAHQAGLKVFVWTVNDINIAKMMCKYGVDGITTNMPGTMKSEMN
jgi:glycerophosphoryl diester phosphodiesterase